MALIEVWSKAVGALGVKLGVTGASAVGTEIFVLGAEPPPGTALKILLA
jgi:hypothetical protein